MPHLRLDDPAVIVSASLVYVLVVLLLLGVSGSLPWPLEADDIVCNILTDALFLGIGVFFAMLILQRVENQRSKTASNSLCGAIARLTALAFMRIANGDMRSEPSLDDPILFRLYSFGGTADTIKEMEAAVCTYQSVVYSSDFQNSIWEGQLDLVPRVKRYLEDTKGIRQSIGSVLFSRVMMSLSDEDIIKQLDRYEMLFADFEASITRCSSCGDYQAVAAEINNFLLHANCLYAILKGRRFMHRMNSLYGPEDPPEFWV